MNVLKPITWLIERLNADKRREAMRARLYDEAWRSTGFTLHTMEGGTLHCASYEDIKNTLDALYDADITYNQIRNAIHRGTPVYVRFAIATITARGKK